MICDLFVGLSEDQEDLIVTWSLDGIISLVLTTTKAGMTDEERTADAFMTGLLSPDAIARLRGVMTEMIGDQT